MPSKPDTLHGRDVTLSPSYAMQSSVSSKPASATDLDTDRISTLCRPLFNEVHSCHPTFMWAGVFGSVSRGTQTPDSDVDIVVGYAPNADFFTDVCGCTETLLERLPETLGVEVDVILFVQQTATLQYVEMEAMLTAKTIWGDDSWPEASRDTALGLLHEGYSRMQKAGTMMSSVRRKLLSSQLDSLMSPEHEPLRFSLLQEVLSVIHLVKVPGDPFYAPLKVSMSSILAKEDKIQAYLQGDVGQEALEGIWDILSGVIITASLKGMRQSAEQTYRRAVLLPPALG